MYTGWLKLSDAEEDINNLDSYSWAKVQAALDLPVFQVLACGNAVMFVTDSEGVWGMGKKVQGSAVDERALRSIHKPHGCKNFKKIVQAKHYRLILTQDYKLFMNGHNLEYLFGYGLGVEENKLAFTELSQTELFALD